MSTEKWIAGSLATLTWTNAFTGSTLNSLGNGSAILSDLAIDNSTTLDMFADVSIALATAVFTSSPYIGIYLYPLNKDGSTYGDGRFGSGTSGPPPSTYFVGSIPLVTATAAQEGTLRSVILPPGGFKWVVYNVGGANFSSSGNTCQYRTYNRSVV